ncbi:MAG: leucyl/phenylalanyl-tRNA--protein transferase [Flavobacteriaceae bacterium]
MYLLSKELWFPNPEAASPEGLLAVGGDLSVARLLLAYRSGIFPWYDAGEPILWWCPDPRMVLFPEKLKVSKSLQKTIKRGTFEVTYNQAFPMVIEACSRVKRKGQRGTWITAEMRQAYQRLHTLGHAHSVEVWQAEQLVGGLYGVDLPQQRIFCGESMFSLKSDASKVGFYHWVQELKRRDYRLIDCQLYTDHLASLGAEEMPREVFLSYLG